MEERLHLGTNRRRESVHQQIEHGPFVLVVGRVASSNQTLELTRLDHRRTLVSEGIKRLVTVVRAHARRSDTAEWQRQLLLLITIISFPIYSSLFNEAYYQVHQGVVHECTTGVGLVQN